MSILIASNAIQPQAWIEALKAVAPDIPVLTLEEVSDVSAIKFALAWNHPAGVFQQFPNLLAVSSMGAGVDHMLKDPDFPGHVPMVRIIDPKLSNDMFEFALAVIMGHLRNLNYHARNQQHGLWKKKHYLGMADVRIGVMGDGVIGSHVATCLQAVGFDVSSWGRTEGAERSYRKYSGSEQLPAFLQQSDVLICLLPLTDSTRGMLNGTHLSYLPQGALVVNLGRGAHVVDADLIRLLDQEYLSGAYLDVFVTEPLPAEHPFWTHPKIHVTPHIASVTTPASVAPQVIENYRRALAGEELLNRVDKARGY